MPMLYASGEGLNLLERARILAHAIGNPGCDPLFPEAHLWDGRPALPTKFLEAINFIVDLAAFENGDFENWPAIDQAEGWTFDAQGGIGSLEQEASVVNGGAFSAQLSGGTEGVRIYREFRVRAGERRRLVSALHGDVTTNGIFVRLINLATGRYLVAGGASWSPNVSNVFGQTAVSFTEHSVNYQVESLARCGGRGMVTLRLEVGVLSGVTGFVDNTNDWPAADLAAFFGLRCADKGQVAWSLSDDGTGGDEALFAGDATAGFSPDQIPNLYIRRTPMTYRRWHRFQVGGSFDPPQLGELVLCQVTQLATMADWGAELRVVEANIRNEVGDGDMQAFGHGLWARRGLVLRWQHAERTAGAAQASMREARDEFWGRARGGRHNILIVPRTDENLVHLVRAEDDWTVRRHFKTFAENELVLMELPFASTAL